MADVSSEQIYRLVKAGLQESILIPTTDGYASRIDSYFNNCAKLRPAYIVMPEQTAEVAEAIKALVTAGQNNNIEGGVAIDLGRMDPTVYDAQSETVKIGAGVLAGQLTGHINRSMKDSYHTKEQWEQPGRPASGLALTGGITLFTGRHGFACDQVVAYEVMLADGRIITADASGAHANLFRALKGGGNNFGVVSHLAMRAFPCSTIWVGGAMLPKEIFPSAAEAFVDFTKRVLDNPDTNLICMLCKLTPKPVTVIVVTGAWNVLQHSWRGKTTDSRYGTWLKFPETFRSYEKDTILGLLNTTEQPTNYYGKWFILCFQNDTTIMMKAAELHNALVEELQDYIVDGDFKTQCVLATSASIHPEIC